MAETTLDELRRAMVATQLRLVLADMLEVRAGLARIGRMDALGERLGEWAGSVAKGVTELERCDA